MIHFVSLESGQRCRPVRSKPDGNLVAGVLRASAAGGAPRVPERRDMRVRTPLGEASTAAQIGREVRVRAEIAVRHRRVFGIGDRRQLRPTVEIVGRSFSRWCSC